MLTLETIVSHYSNAFKAVDTPGPVNMAYRPGIGPFGEPQGIGLALRHLKQRYYRRSQEV